MKKLNNEDILQTLEVFNYLSNNKLGEGIESNDIEIIEYTEELIDFLREIK